MTKEQSLAQFGHPYGIEADLLLISLNTMIEARARVDHTSRIYDLLTTNIQVILSYLEAMKTARPIEYSATLGYTYTNMALYGGWPDTTNI